MHRIGNKTMSQIWLISPQFPGPEIQICSFSLKLKCTAYSPVSARRQRTTHLLLFASLSFLLTHDDGCYH